MPSVNPGPNVQVTPNLVANYANSVSGTAASMAPYVIAQSAIPSGVAPTGSVATNGALTLGTALATTYSGGIWLALPAGAAYAGSAAGSYWCVMTSATLGTIYNNILGVTQGLMPSIPTFTNPITAAGPGAYTGVTTIQQLGGGIIPGAAMGPNGTIRAWLQESHNNSAGIKTPRLDAGVFPAFTLPIISYAASTNTNGWALGYAINRGIQQIQISVSGAAGAGLNQTLTQSSIDMSQPTPWFISGTLNTATDFLIIESFVVEILPA